MTVFRWQELNRQQLNAQVSRSLVVIPTGATEQHGPHLATGHDAITVEAIALEAASRSMTAQPIIITPPVAFGSSEHHVSFGGTLSLSTDTYYRLVREIVTSAIRSGAARLFILNGHGGNRELNQLVARDVALAESGVAIAAGSYWEIADAALRALPGVAAHPIPGHAGYFETSTMLALDPTRVSARAVRTSDPSRPATEGPAGVRIERSGSWASFDGFTDVPHLADADAGRAALDAICREVAAAFDAFMA